MYFRVRGVKSQAGGAKVGENKTTAPLIRVEITHEKLRRILDLPENTVMATNDLLKNKGVMKRFVRRYLYLFELAAEKRCVIADWAMAFKMVNSDDYILPYTDAYPEVLPILFLAWAFGLAKIWPEMNGTSSFPVSLTFKGRRVYRAIARDCKKGRPAEYPIGELWTYEDVDREWEEIVWPLAHEARRKAVKGADKIIAEDNGFYVI